MELVVFVEPQQSWTYDDLRQVAFAAESHGFDGFFRSDHFLRMDAETAPPGSTDAWATLAGLARETERIRLGTLLSAATFRLPGQLAVIASTVDQMSGGRLELGLGAGGFPDEHEAYGIPYPELARIRRERWEEQLEILTRYFATAPGQTFSFTGAHYRLSQCPALPRPLQRHVPLIVGGSGLVRTPGIAARYADEFNIGFRPIEHLVSSYRALDEACRLIGREPASVRRSCARTLCCGENLEEVERRAAAIGHDLGDLRARGIAGTPDEAIAALARYAAIGVSRVYLQVLDLTDLAHLALVGREVLPHARGLQPDLGVL
jgi:F420-dependent oxidoreductase-like protein